LRCAGEVFVPAESGHAPSLFAPSLSAFACIVDLLSVLIGDLMTHDDTNDGGKLGKASPRGKAGLGQAGSDFDRRLDSLRDRLAEQGHPHDGAGETQGARPDGSSLGQALRLSSEFVAGIIGGGVIGWVIDRFLGTSPWGIIVFFLLGFAAGILNVLRASGFVKTKAVRKIDDLRRP
jgi:ATP synthase protein I